MWPLYDPSMYQPPAPTKRLTPAEFVAVLTELEHKPDVDNVFEAMSTLQGQESLRPRRMTVRQFLLHPYMIIPGVALLTCVAILVTNTMQIAVQTGRAGGALPQLTRMPDVTRTGSPIFILCLALFVLLVAVRSTIRDKDPEVVEMRAAAAACIARMALHPKYIHEPFSSSDAAYLRRLLKGRSFDADKALGVLMSKQGGAREPDPDFIGGEQAPPKGARRRSKIE